MTQTSDGPKVYCGPNIPGGMLASHTVFSDDIPPHIEVIAQRCPELGELIVPLSEMNSTTAACMTRGTRENTCYVEILKFFKK